MTSPMSGPATYHGQVCDKISIVRVLRKSKENTAAGNYRHEINLTFGSKFGHMKKFTIEFTWAVIFTLASLLWTVLEKSLGFHDARIGSQMIFSWLFGIPAVVIYFFALKDKRNNFFNGVANWRQLFLSGVIVSVFVALMSPLAQYISNHVVSPDYIKNAIRYFVDVRKMSEENARVFFSPRSLILQSISNGISVGVLLSSVLALVLKTAPPQPETPPSKTKKK